MQLDAITVGDSIMDMYISIHDTARYCRIDHGHSEICFEAGQKIIIDNAEFHLGGNASNVAVGLTRLGFKTALVAEHGDDEFAQKIEKSLADEGVALDFIRKTSGAQSTFSIVIGFMNERTLFARHVEREHDFSFENVSAKWVYLTSLGNKWQGVYKKVHDFITTSGGKLMFNPGTLQLSTGRENYKDLLSITEFLIVNKEEAEEIVYGAIQHTENHATTPDILTKELQKLGPKNVCVTDGRKGAYILSQEGDFFTQGITDGKIVGKTGAGDAFSTGVLAGILAGKDYQEAMRWGAVESASVIEHIGAEVGLLTKEGLDKRMEWSFK